jgi:hypothetical protein
MNKYFNRYHRSAALELESSSEGKRVKVSYRPITINQSVSSIPKEYVTPYYSTSEEAFIYARGWVDCMLHFTECKEIPNDNEDSYKKRYEELLEGLENNSFEQDIDNSSASKEERELAYQAGWKSKLVELNNMEVRNPE